MTFAEYREKNADGQATIGIDNKVAYRLIHLLPKRYQRAQMFWLWIGILSIPLSVLLMIFTKWWIGLLVVLFVTPAIFKANMKSALQFVLDYAHEDEKFFNYLLESDLLLFKEDRMDRAGHLPGGLISEIINKYSQKKYMISTAQEIGQDYWSTSFAPKIEKRKFLGLIKKHHVDNLNSVSFIRNNKKDAHSTHYQLKRILISSNDKNWLDNLPSRTPPEGYSAGAKEKLRSTGC